MVIFLISCRTRCSLNSFSCLLLESINFWRLTFFSISSFCWSRIVWSSSRCCWVFENSFAIFSYDSEWGDWLTRRICSRSSSRSNWVDFSSFTWLIAWLIFLWSLARKALLGLIIWLKAAKHTSFSRLSDMGSSVASYKVMIVACYAKPFNNLAMFVRVVIGDPVVNIPTASTEYF